MSDKTETGVGTKEIVVRADMQDARDWLAEAPVCAALTRYRIAHVGVAVAAHPYRVVRMRLGGTYFMACFGGEGRVWLEGGWKPMRAGMACLAPPNAFNAYRSLPGKRWGFAWVRYQETPGSLPLVSTRMPVLAPFDGRPLRAAIKGLHCEAGAGAAPAALQLWTDLIEHYAQKFAQPWRTDDRLGNVWLQVAAKLAEDWPLKRLARLAGLGTKQFSRICQQGLGRTPTRHVTWMRMQRAAAMLATTHEKVSAIALAVGFSSPFTFSHNFQRFAGCRPSAYRGAHTTA